MWSDVHNFIGFCVLIYMNYSMHEPFIYKTLFEYSEKFIVITNFFNGLNANFLF